MKGAINSIHFSATPPPPPTTTTAAAATTTTANTGHFSSLEHAPVNSFYKCTAAVRNPDDACFSFLSRLGTATWFALGEAQRLGAFIPAGGYGGGSSGGGGEVCKRSSIAAGSGGGGLVGGAERQKGASWKPGSTKL